MSESLKRFTEYDKTTSLIYSARAECMFDANRITDAVKVMKHVAVKRLICEPFPANPDGFDSGEVMLEFEFEQPVRFGDLLRVISALVDRHVALQTLEPVCLEGNKLTREYLRF